VVSKTANNDRGLRALVGSLNEAGIPTDRFVNVLDGEKKCIDHTQQEPSEIDGNYGVYAGRGLILLDIDDGDELPDNFVGEDSPLPETLIAKTPHSGMQEGHLYLACPDDIGEEIEDEFGVTNPAPSWGEIRVENQYVVGPGSQLDGCGKDGCDACADADGGKYEIERDEPIGKIEFSDLGEILDASEGVERAEENEDNQTQINYEIDDEDEIIQYARENDDTLDKLYKGNYSAAGYDDRSSADCALAMKLAFWLQGDKQRVRSAMDDSRAEKWHERDDDGYRDSVLEAVDKQNEHYEPHQQQESSDYDAEELTADDGEFTHPYPELFGWIAEQKASDDGGPTNRAIQNEAQEIFLKHEDFATDPEKTEKEGNIYRYNEETGLYERDGEQYIKGILIDALGELYTSQVCSEVYDRIRGKTTIEPDEWGVDEGELPIEDGILEVDKWVAGNEDDAVREYSPDDYIREKSPVPSKDIEGEPDMWNQYLKMSVQRESDRKKLQEYVGYILGSINSMPRHKVLFLAGPTRSGKSTFIDIMTSLIPDRKVSSMEPQNMTEKFNKLPLRDAWVNVSSDIKSDAIQDTGTFKMLSAEDKVTARIKFVQKQARFRPSCKHVYSANELPTPGEMGAAFWERCLIVPFPDTVAKDERIEGLSEKIIQEEGPAVLKWALEGYRRLQEQDGFTGDRDVQRTREKWHTWSTSVFRFAARATRRDMGAREPQTTVYEAYQEFVASEYDDIKVPKSRQAFTKQLKRLGHIGVDARCEPRQYTNIRLASEYAQNDDDRGGDTSGGNQGRWQG